MAEKLLMQALSPTMETGAVARWLKKEGDPVRSGDVLLEVETDKAVMEYESVKDGVLLKILADKGKDVPIGAPIGIIGKAGEDISGLIEELKSFSLPAAPKAESGIPSLEPSVEVRRSTGPESRIKASPLARRIAGEKGIDLSLIVGTGPEGRIIKADLEKAIEKAETTGKIEGRIIPHSKKRRVIAQRLSASKFTAPHYYLKLSVNCRSLLEARKEINRGRAGKVSLNAFILKMTAEAIKKHPQINGTWSEKGIILNPSVDIGLAVAAEDGLITPVVRSCENKGILQIDDELGKLLEKARENRLKPEEFNGATFTVSNLGSYGIEEFTAIINPPGSAILAVGAITRTPVITEDEKGNESVEVQSLMKLTLSCDHRVIDGAPGALFLRELKNLMENPVRALF